MTGDDPRLLVVTSGVTSQLEHFSGQVFHDSSQVDGSTRPDTLSIVAFTQEPVDSSDRELEPSTAGPALALPLHFPSLATATHDLKVLTTSDVETRTLTAGLRMGENTQTFSPTPKSGLGYRPCYPFHARLALHWRRDLSNPTRAGVGRHNRAGNRVQSEGVFGARFSILFHSSPSTQT